MDRQDLSFKEIYVHPEEEPNVKELNENLLALKKDLSYIDNGLIKTANNFNELISSARVKLLSIKELLIAEKERQQDINILCNKYSDFSSIVNLKAEDFEGSLTFKNDILQSRITSYKTIDYNIDSIDGNGFTGNKYVYLNDNFLEKVINTSSFDNIKDNNLATCFEYSRITTSTKEDVPSLFNKDSIEAECVITLSSKDMFNNIEFFSERDDIVLKEVYTSLDGLTYKLDKEYNIAINDRNEMYNNHAYIYGSGIISVESCRYVKLVLRSNGYSNDRLAFTKVFLTDTSNDNVIEKVQFDTLSKRHVIKVNEIRLSKNNYSKGLVLSRELITTPVKCIALYCNAYINDTYSLKNNINYYLIINGREYEVQPINSHEDGKKIIRMSSQNFQSDYVTYLNEDIKSAKLKIVINTSNSDITPYISDIKILVGGDI